VADQGVGETKNTFGNAPGVHQFAGKNEEGDGQEGEVIYAVKHPLGDNLIPQAKAAFVEHDD
jgi:hypothetical protein